MNEICLVWNFILALVYEISPRTPFEMTPIFHRNNNNNNSSYNYYSSVFLFRKED